MKITATYEVDVVDEAALIEGAHRLTGDGRGWPDSVSALSAIWPHLTREGPGLRVVCTSATFE